MPVAKPAGADQTAVTPSNTDGAIGGLPISDPPTQAEVLALLDKCEQLADDVRALAGALLELSTRGGIIVVGSLNLGGSVEMLPNAVALVEIAVEKQAAVLLMPVAARRQLNELPDELWTKINIEFYSDAADAFFKALTE